MAGESDFGAGAGVGVAAAVSGFAGVVCFDGAAVVLLPAGLGLAFCAAAIGASINANSKIQGDIRFMKCIFLIASQVVNFGVGQELACADLPLRLGKGWGKDRIADF